MRIVITSGTIVLSDGRRFDLVVPSGASSGLKVFVTPPIQVVGGVSADLLLDIDLAQSFEPIPNSAVQASDIRDFHFHPVVRAANVSMVGRIVGRVTNANGGAAIAGATARALQQGTVIATATTDATGSFAIIGLAPGVYDLTVEAVGFQSATDPGLIVAAGNSTTANVQLVPLP